MPKSPMSLTKFCRMKRVSCEVIKNFKHCRVAPPEFFDRRSFRVKTVDKERDIKITVGCPKGKYDSKEKRCRVGTRTQKMMYPKRLSPALSTLKKIKQQAKSAWC